MATPAGPVYTTSVDSERRDIDISADIPRLTPDEAKFTVLLSKIAKEIVDTAECKWYDELEWGNYTQINLVAGYAAGDVTFVVDDESVFNTSDLLQCPRTGETMLVSSIDSAAHTVTVTRSWGTVAAAALVDNDYLVRLGNAMVENSSAPTSKLMQPTEYHNYTQIFRTVFDGSGTQEAEKLKAGGAERIRLRKSKLMEHLKDIERALLFGEHIEDTTNHRRSLGGLNEFVTTNRVNQGSVVMTESAWEDICETAFKYGSGSKLLIACPSLITQLNAFPAGKLQTVSKEETYGLRMNRYISAHGDLLIVKSEALRNGLATFSFIVDVKNLKYAPLRTRDTKLRANIQANDLDGWKDEYMTEATLKVRQEATHTVLYNVA